MHGADQHIDLVALHQFVGVFNAFGWVRLVVYLEKFNLATPQLAALLIDGSFE